MPITAEITNGHLDKRASTGSARAEVVDLQKSVRPEPFDFAQESLVEGRGFSRCPNIIRQRGASLIIVLILVMAASALILRTTQVVATTHEGTRNSLNAVKAHEAAHAGLHRGLDLIRTAAQNCNGHAGSTQTLGATTQSLGETGYRLTFTPGTFICPDVAAFGAGSQVVIPINVTSDGCAEGCDVTTPAAWHSQSGMTDTVLITFADSATNQAMSLHSNINALILQRGNATGYNFNKSSIGTVPGGNGAIGNSILAGGTVNGIQFQDGSSHAGSVGGNDATIGGFADADAMIAYYLSPTDYTGSAHTFVDDMQDQATTMPSAANNLCPNNTCPAGGIFKTTATDTTLSNKIFGSPLAPNLIIVSPGTKLHLNKTTCYCIIVSMSSNEIQLNDSSNLVGALINTTTNNSNTHIENSSAIKYDQRIFDNLNILKVNLPVTSISLLPTTWAANSWKDF